MEKHYSLNCNCKKICHNKKNCLEHKNCSCKRCCHNEYCRTCHCNLCREDLCGTDFKIRLAGLQGGLNFRLSQQLWREAEFELDNGNIIKGMIVFVGSNFIEVQVDEIVEDSLQDLDKELTQESPAEENKLNESETRHHRKGKTWIFSIDKIVHVKLSSSNHQIFF
ncbi:hypothetical protein [Bacillus sp. Cr_A10]|uniref:hypothetical protein n=1 Tax=Bacillus sp. Cr_A10 TaxID=3033993 RepID=UPI0023DA0557|nr:hypothetical protein [Bacillus sp. Cr_A10]MDF2066990.1 hypothetical protein [Bacillus sp. Cr_A10]